MHAVLKFLATWWPYLAPVLAVLVATLVSVFVPHDPAKPRSWWQNVLVVLQKLLTAYAPVGTDGIGGTRVSVPLLHYPKPSDENSAPTLPISKVGILLPIAFLVGAGAVAHADVPRFSTGPSAQFFRAGWKPKDPSRLDQGNTAGVDVLSAGLGWSFHYNPPRLVRGEVCWLSVDGTLFAQLSGLPSTGGMALAAGLSTYNGLAGLAVGYKLFELYDQANRPMEGLFAGGEGGVRNLFFLVNLSVNVLFAASTAPQRNGLWRAAPPAPPNYWRVR